MNSESRILLCSIFGPYAIDNKFSSRRLKPMALYDSQVTRGQAPFSLQMSHPSLGIRMIQVNIKASCVVLDYPTLERFKEEITTHAYDVIGISAIVSNVATVQHMCSLIRKHQPNATIVIGGHIASVENLKDLTGADEVVVGDGIRWFREQLGEDPNGPIRNPVVSSATSQSLLGRPIKNPIAGVFIPSAGCPKKCDFCATSAFFRGRVSFYQTAEEMYSVMCQITEKLNVSSLFIMDENWLMDRPRTLRLLELMEKDGKTWSLYVFASADVLKQYTIDELIRLGVSWVWIGLEGENSQYPKLNDTDTLRLVKDLQSHGIRVLGSVIIGLMEHNLENISKAIKFAASHECVFLQGMLWTPLKGTPLYKRIVAAGLMKPPGSFDEASIHGQTILNWKHPAFNDAQTEELMNRLFWWDFEVNGPSIARMARVTLDGFQKYKDHGNPRVRARVALEAARLPKDFSALVTASVFYFLGNKVVRRKMFKLLWDLWKEFGLKSVFFSAVGGPLLLWHIYKEKRALADGKTYEPPITHQANALAHQQRPDVPLCPSAVPMPINGDCMAQLMSIETNT